MRPDPSARERTGRDRAGRAWRRVADDDRNPSLGFPRCLIIRGRKYRLRHELLQAFKTRSIAATASGGAATTAPNPHRRLAKKPQPAGGVVAG
jgi:hypothetical protein